MTVKKAFRLAYIVIGFAVALILANLVFGLVLSGQDKEVTILEEKVADLRALTSKRPGTGSATRVAIARFQNALPREQEITSILEEVFKAAARNGILVPSGNYNSVTSNDGLVSRYIFTLPVEGKYAGLKRFLYELEAAARPLVVEEVTLAGSLDEDRVGLKIMMSAYYR